jgi:hypothetical protein
MSCPQPWAAKIHAEETGQTPDRAYTIRGIPPDQYRELRIIAAERETSLNALLLDLILKATAGRVAEGKNEK